MSSTLTAGDAGTTSAQHQYLTFLLASEEYGLEILKVQEIRGYTAVTPIPHAPPHIKGVMNLRGAVVPVVDLASRFGGKASQITRRSCIVILELTCDEEAQVIGVVVDAVNEVLEIAASEIEPPPTFGTRIRTDFIQGMGKVQERFVIILNVNNVLSTDDLLILGKASNSTYEAAA